MTQRIEFIVIKGNWIVGLLVLSAFGPYVGGGLRTEQLFFLAALATVSIAAMNKSKYTFTRSPILFVGLWISGLVAAALATISAVTVRVFGEFSFSLQEADNWLMPLVFVLLTWCLLHLYPRADLVASFCKWFLLMILLNVGLQATQLVQSDDSVWINDILINFWSGDPENSVGQRVSSSGRYTGVFNQPAEAGIAYALAIVTVVYMIRTGKLSTRISPLIFALVTIGGLLTISRTFVLVGLPLAIVWLVWKLPLKSLILSLFSLIALLFVSWNWFLADRWIRSEGIGEWLLSFGSLGGLSGGRYVAESALISGTMDTTLNLSPLIGLGIDPGLLTDSELVRSFSSAGLIGIILLLSLYGYLIKCLLQSRWEIGRQDWLFGLSAVLILIGGGLGVPAISANRIGSLLLFIITALILTGCQMPKTGLRKSGPPRNVLSY